MVGYRQLRCRNCRFNTCWALWMWRSVNLAPLRMLSASKSMYSLCVFFQEGLSSVTHPESHPFSAGIPFVSTWALGGICKKFLQPWWCPSSPPQMSRYRDSSPPCRRSWECCLLPVILHVMVPLCCINREQTVEIFIGTCPMVWCDLMIAMAKGTQRLSVSL